MDHDFDAQKADTFATFKELAAENTLPDEADLDFFFVAGSAEADWRPLAQELEQADFLCDWVDDDEAGDTPYLIATLPDQPVSAQAIWVAEELATQIALRHGFVPEGWGMEG